MTPHTHMHTPRQLKHLSQSPPATKAQTTHNEKERERENKQGIIYLLAFYSILVAIMVFRLYTVGHTWTLVTLEVWIYVAIVTIMTVAMIGLLVAEREKSQERT